MEANLIMPKTDGVEITPGIFLIGNPSPRPDISPTALACLANIHGMLCLVELKLSLTDKPNWNKK